MVLDKSVMSLRKKKKLIKSLDNDNLGQDFDAMVQKMQNAAKQTRQFERT